MKSANEVIKMISKKFNVKSFEVEADGNFGALESFKIINIEFVIESKLGMPCLVEIQSKDISKSIRQIKGIVERQLADECIKGN